MSTDITDLCDIEFYRVHYSNVIYSIVRAGSPSRCNKKFWRLKMNKNTKTTNNRKRKISITINEDVYELLCKEERKWGSRSAAAEYLMEKNIHENIVSKKDIMPILVNLLVIIDSGKDRNFRERDVKKIKSQVEKLWNLI